MREETKKVFVADDGKVFVDKAECEKYESFKKDIKYFKVMANPDLTETGCMQNTYCVAVYSKHFCHRHIVENWCVQEMHWPILGVSVMGYGFQEHFTILPSTEKEYFLPNGNYMEGSYLLSPIAFDGYPEPFDYMTAWGFK